jgi:multicomponent Na+:H+ antiporter subunit C
MELLLAITTGTLFATGLYMVLRRSIIKILIGLLLLGYAVNLLLFGSTKLIPAKPPLIPLNTVTVDGLFADPVPQALILTAIVISFGVTAFAIVLMRQVFKEVGSDDLNEIRCTDIPCEQKEIPVDDLVTEESA